MNYFNPEDMLKRYAVVKDFARHEPLQVYPVARAGRIPMAKQIGEVFAFDHREAQQKAERLFS